MGLFEKIFPAKKSQLVGFNGKWETLTAYNPVFTSRGGSAYEMELVRSSIDARARHIGKLSVVLQGQAKKTIATKLKRRPNSFMTYYKFLYRLSTILDLQNTAFIVPILDEFDNITGIYPVLPSRVEIVEWKGEAWLRYQFANGKKASIELNRCGIMTKYQYDSDIFGGTASALNDTLDLIDLQKKGLREAIKNGATYRFMAQSSNFAKTDDLAKERKRFNAANFSSEDDGGAFLLLPSNWANIKQIDQTAFTINEGQMNLIQTNVFNYYGVNENILQNKALGDELDAFYNGCIEPFAIMLGEVLTDMLFTDNEIDRGNKVVISADRLQYMSTEKKISMVQQLGDRGMITINEARALFNYMPIDGGDAFMPIRGEYYNLTDKNEGEQSNASDK